ncbi:MAG: hypothetical protein FJ104_00625 [Deltaproteobacteria bacterium]|nr:hypothetical protein [Deltaproteobacteria bacterium]
MPHHQAVTVFDGRRVGLFRDEDLKRLEHPSEVIGFSDPTTLAAVLAA